VTANRTFSSRRSVSASSIRRIWGKNGYRVFLSHRSQVRKRTAALKEGLERFGISAFVAHADIHPTKAWQDEIESALSTMDAFVALMTEHFHESEWTDQEVGFAFARDVPMVAVNLGRNPYGFIGKFQSLSCSWATASERIVSVLIKQEGALDAYVEAVGQCPSFDEGNRLAAILPAIDKLSDDQADALVAAYNENHEVFHSFGFNGSKPFRFGKGLLHHLGRTNDRSYREGRTGRIKIVE
jgi:hypothetical protein